jgi:predicted porin
MYHKTILAAAVALALSAGVARAADWTDMFQFHAYGTADVVHSSQSQADFVSSYLQQTQGAGYTRSWSPDVDSKLAGQIDAHFTDKLSAVVQLVSENDQNSTWTGRPNPRYRPSLEWANVKYLVTDSLSVRVGRMVLPSGMLSEYRNVGYSLQFVRAPEEIYGQIPFTNMDGGQVSYAGHFGGITNTLMGGYGANTIRTNAVGTAQARIAVLTDTVEIQSFTVRAAALAVKFKAPIGFGSLYTDFADAAATIPGGSDAANTANYLDSRYNTDHWGNVETYDIGATYDPGQWFAMGELSYTANTGVVGNSTSGFAVAGYRTHGIGPYVSYARLVTSHLATPVIPVTSLPPPLAAYGSTINGLIAGINASNQSQSTLATGVRWDFMKNFDLKVQYEYVRLDAGSTGMFVNEQPGFRPGSTASVFTAGVDFVF